VARRRLEQLERNYKAFFYWFALHGQPQPQPRKRLVAILIDKKEEFEKKHKLVFDNVEMVADGFFARRDNLAVFSSKSLDLPFQALEKKFNETMLSHNWSGDELLQGKGYKGKKYIPGEVEHAQVVALVHSAMQEDAERATVTHEGTRQLIAAIGLLPRSVEAPKWIDFGTAAFFETSKGSYWPTTGGPNLIYQLNFKYWDSQKPKMLEKAGDAMRDVVTDTYFKKIKAARSKERAEMKARAMTWALTHFLATKHRDGLVKYFGELSRAPRDLALDSETLRLCFARAFDLLDGTKKTETIDQTKWDNLANQWYQLMQVKSLELEVAYQEMLALLKEKEAANSGTPGTQGIPGQQGRGPGMPNNPGQQGRNPGQPGRNGGNPGGGNGGRGGGE
jgi:hypothetical protein